MNNKEWLEVEHILRFLEPKNMKAIDFYRRLNKIYVNLIGLMGCKLEWDKNEVFYENSKNFMIKDIEYLEDNYLINKSLEIQVVKDFINNNF